MPRRHNPLGELTGTSRPRGKAASFKPTRQPYAPKDLPEDGRKMWRHLTGLLGDTGVLDEVDRYALELICNAYGMWKRANAEYMKAPVVDGSKGQPVRRPWGDIAKTEAERLRMLLTEFGMTPAARVKLGALQKDTAIDKELEAILGGG